MQAMVVRKYGPPEVFELRDVPDPQPKPGQALIRVRAIGINFADLLARLGVYGNTPKPPFVPGLEFSGEVEQVILGGEKASVPPLAPGDRVAFVVEGDQIRLERIGSVARRTAGMLSSVLPALSLEDEREAAEQAIVEATK